MIRVSCSYRNESVPINLLEKHSLDHLEHKEEEDKEDKEEEDRKHMLMVADIKVIRVKKGFPLRR